LRRHAQTQAIEKYGKPAAFPFGHERALTALVGRQILQTENVMKRNSLGTLSLAALVLTFTAAAHAQTMEQATIPFAFQAGPTQLPAGRYVIKEDHVRETVKIWNIDRGLVAIVPVQQSALAAVRAGLIFHNIGDQHFLAEINGGMDALNLTLLPSKREQQAQALRVAAAPETIKQTMQLASK
jgi:hypothetical protein